MASSNPLNIVVSAEIDESFYRIERKLRDLPMLMRNAVVLQGSERILPLPRHVQGDGMVAVLATAAVAAGSTRKFSRRSMLGLFTRAK
jgi:hypothetical protein